MEEEAEDKDDSKRQVINYTIFLSTLFIPNYIAFWMYNVFQFMAAVGTLFRECFGYVFPWAPASVESEKSETLNSSEALWIGGRLLGKHFLSPHEVNFTPA